ncbi:MAG TPA: exosortase/archaeosortase family protein [Bryobacteraceae bacterium]|nr:exosortase/archaeosortase family protein [Bryobacteraceae bacterium]
MPLLKTEPAPPQQAVRFPVRTTAEIGFLAVIAIAIYARTLAGLFDDWWTQPSYSQGLLLPPLALYFAWLDRKAVLAAPVARSRAGLWMIAAGCFVYLTGKLSAEFFLQRISLLVVLAGVIWLYWGKARLRSLLFPLILLATSIPLPALLYNTATAPLQLFASEAAAYIAQLCNVSIYRDGNIMELAHISLGVDEACSGLNSFSALLVAALLLGRFMCDRFPARALLFVLSAPLSIAVNVLRVAGTAILADYNETFALGFYHTFAGWLVFVVGFFAFTGMAKLAHAVLERRQGIS